MLLVIDVGNTNTVVGLYDGTNLVQHWRLETNRGKTEDEYGILLRQLLDVAGLKPDVVNAAIMSSVVPPLGETFVAVMKRYFDVRLTSVGPGTRTGMPIRYENPREVGADRIVNAVAAFDRCHTAAVVVDFGTATTFDAIGGDGSYLGGAIAPGVKISTEALFLAASKLPRVELTPPRSVIGRNTTESMQAGFIFGYVGLVDGIVERMKSELSKESNIRVIATGGLATLIAKESRTIDDVEPLLTLEGLRILYSRNDASSGGHR